MKPYYEIYRAPAANFNFARVLRVLIVLGRAPSDGTKELKAMANALLREREDSGARRMAMGCLAAYDDESLAFQVPVDRKSVAQIAWESTEPSPSTDNKGASA